MKKSVKILKNNRNNMISKIILVIAIIIIFSISFGKNNVYAKNMGKINTPNIILREGPTTESNKLGNMYKTDVVEVLEESGEWYKIIFNGKTGYTKKEFIDINGKSEIKKTENNEEKKNKNTGENKKQEVEEGQNENNSKQETEKKADEKNKASSSEKGSEDSSKEKNRGSGELKKITKDISLKTQPLIYAMEIEKIAAGKEVEVMSVRGKWTKIEFDGKFGWIPNNSLEK